MSTLTQDRAYLQMGVKELEAYLLSDELYWPLAGKSELPRLTLGGLLLAQRRLAVRLDSLADQAELKSLEAHMAAIGSKWSVAWERKASREVQNRFNLWRDFLDEYQHSPDRNAADYPSRVQGRVMIHLLGELISPRPPEFAALQELDARLRSAWIAGEFIWEHDLAAAFPESEYWYLYGKLKTT